MAVNEKSLKNLRNGPPAPKGNNYSSMAAQRRARIQQLCTMDARQLTNLKGKTVYDDMIIRMLKSKNAKDHELIMKADAPGLLREDVNVSGNLGITTWSQFVNSDTDPDTETDNDES